MACDPNQLMADAKCLECNLQGMELPVLISLFCQIRDNGGTGGGGVPPTRNINTTAPLTGGGNLSADLTLGIPKATAAVDGYLSAADFATFNAKGNGTVTNFSAGTLTPLFTTSVATSTTTPALTFAQISQNQNLFYGSPDGAPGNPGFRALVANDIPSLASVYVPVGRTVTIAGTANQVISSAGAQDLSANRTWTLSLPQNIDTAAAVQFGTVLAKYEQDTEVAIAAAAIDWSAGGVFTKTIAANTTFTFSNVTAGRVIRVVITGDASHTVTWPAVKWGGGVAPVQTLSKDDVYTFISLASGTIYGSAVQNMS